LKGGKGRKVPQGKRISGGEKGKKGKGGGSRSLLFSLIGKKGGKKERSCTSLWTLKREKRPVIPLYKSALSFVLAEKKGRKESGGKNKKRGCLFLSF